VFVDQAVDQALNDVAKKTPDHPDQQWMTGRPEQGFSQWLAEMPSLHVTISPETAVQYASIPSGTLVNPGHRSVRRHAAGRNIQRGNRVRLRSRVRHSDFYTAVLQYHAGVLPAVHAVLWHPSLLTWPSFDAAKYLKLAGATGW